MAFEPTTVNYRDALRRLCTRCSAAGEEPLLKQALADEGDDPQALLRALQALLLSPELTLPTATICRPALLAVVASLVDEAAGAGGSAAGQPPAVVAAALVQIMLLAPHTQPEVVQYFRSAPGPFSSLFDKGGAPQPLSAGLTPTILARCTLWGLQESRDLQQMWQWPELLPLLSHPDPDVRWCGAHSLGLVLGGRDTVSGPLLQRLMSTDEVASTALRWQNACASMAAEQAAALGTGNRAARTAQEPITVSPSRKRKHAEAGDGCHGWPLPPPSKYTNVCGLDLPRRDTAPVASLSVHDLVLTPSMRRNMAACALGLCLRSALLVEGAPSSGKSALIAHLAAVTGNAADMVHIHLDDQTDSKTLLGAYVCASKPGEFVWQPGLLTQGVTRGSWVVIEDINLASPEVLATLLPLLERRVLHVPSRGEELAAAQGFQLICTVTSDPGALGAGVYGSSAAVKDLLGGLFHSVRMEPAAAAEQADIVARLFPSVGPLVPHAMASVALVQVATRQRAATAADLEDAATAERVTRALAAAGLRPGEAALGRFFSFRDVLKWARRMVTLHSPLIARCLRPSVGDFEAQVADVPVALREAAFAEAADCLCAGLSRHDVADKLLAALAAIWAVPASFAEHYAQLAKPTATVEANRLLVGRAALPLLQSSNQMQASSRFARTGHAMRHLERVAVAAANAEPVLLVGETGTGKTTLVQEIASQVGAKLVVVNLSQQTDSSDLIGGFRPLQPADSVVRLLQPFVDLVRRTWQRGNNDEFLDRVVKLATKRRWRQLVKAFRTAVQKTGMVAAGGAAEGPAPVAREETSDASKKPRRAVATLEAGLGAEWKAFVAQVDAAEATALAAEGGFAFAFFEGALLDAVRQGWWILLDEVNLAPAEALERISGLLEDDGGGITVAERGDVDMVAKHPSFRLFAAMNPATDAGKRDLPGSLRNRFTEIWVGEPRHREDFAAIVAGHLLPVSMSAPVDSVVDFYVAVKDAADTSLQDGAGHKPTYNLRTLSRALEYAARTSAVYGLQRALYDGFAMSFLTQLDPMCTPLLEQLMQQHLVGKGTSLKALLNAVPSAPAENCVLFEHYWVEVGQVPVAESREDDGKGGVFVTTPAVSQHLRNLARAVLLRKYPILLQGPTSSGKTSLVAYLAAQTGHHFIRINNHEQTDLQEYLGTFISDEHGRLIFQEGLLVQAVRHGHWIVLDELNLAPTEVLEALNRLLDDNRELFVPELQEVVKPHPHFMLFATQNPPGLYAGRKTLSRAFRSRFLELHVEDIPDNELPVILEKRCSIAPSYAAKLVNVQRELQRQRAMSNVFAGRHGFITPRDLFRWAGRGAVGYQQLAEDGFAVLGERLRSEDERNTVRQVLEKLLNTKIDMEALYSRVEKPAVKEEDSASMGVGRLVWTHTFRRMYWLLDRCLRNLEPALLVGETGLGKTSVCQLASYARGQTLRIINCNQHTETSDFLGGYRPNRSRDQALSMLYNSLNSFNIAARSCGLEILEKPNATSLTALQELVAGTAHIVSAASAAVQEELRLHSQAMAKHFARYRAPFEWVDGPLVAAMKQGDIVLIDELNLAEDAVLERLNSVLEQSRSLTLAEKGGESAEVIIAHPNFRVIATMNPGGDYGKKELSPALSNRFSTIWVPAMEDEGELQAILETRLEDHELRQLITPLLLKFWAFFRKRIASAARHVLSVRDLLTWIEFTNKTAGSTSPYVAYAHGAYVAFLDGLGLGVGLSEEASLALRSKCFQFLVDQLPESVQHDVFAAISLDNAQVLGELTATGRKWGISPFMLDAVQDADSKGAVFEFTAPTTAKNTFRVIRAMQLRKPILLEGSPGVGKTSLIAAISKALGHGFVRINLSEQTDMMDLLGADLPVEGGNPGDFAWSDGPLLQAIKSGAWVLLDELNLANQTVLEGLNALLDHRSEVFIPELNTTFKCPASFRIFGAQNPLQEGGGRKGLPKSFLSRFSRVYVELLQRPDLLFIAATLYPMLERALIQRMVDFLDVIHRDSRDHRSFGSIGGPFEFNLRDLLRWCELITFPSACMDEEDKETIARHYAHMLFVSRMRTPEDRGHVLDVLAQFFSTSGGNANESPRFLLLPDSLTIGCAKLDRKSFCAATAPEPLLLTSPALLESIAKCISLGWMCLLVGPSGTGKTAAVRTLAQLCGRSLLELPLNAGTDTSDLLGGFEQVDMVRKRHSLIGHIDDVLAELAAILVESAGLERLADVRSLATSWTAAKAAETASSSTAAAANVVICGVDKIHRQIRNDERMGAIAERLHRASALADVIISAGENMDGRFEWVDGSLTRAIIEGRWVVLDNANLCNPSVLDRLNPLLEPHGVLYLNECGTGAQGPRIIAPHPEFRIFLTFDPKHAEVSRAMRNRGIELFLLPTRTSGLAMDGTERSGDGLASIASIQNIPGTLLPAFVEKIHAEIRGHAISRHRRPPSVRELTRWTSMVHALCARGLDAAMAVQMAFQHVYVQPSDDSHAREEAQAAMSAAVAKGLLKPGFESWFQPARWPAALTIQAFSSDSAACGACRDIGPLVRWAGLCAMRGGATSLADFEFSSVLARLAEGEGLAVTALVPGVVLEGLLLGQQPLLRLKDATDAVAITEAVASLWSALLVFMERGYGEAFHRTWATATIIQCRNMATAIAPGSTGHMITTLLSDVAQTLSAYFSHPLPAADPDSSKLPALRRAVGVAATVQRGAAQSGLGIQEASRTLLQLSCWRFHNPGSRNKLPAPHAAVDWLWPLFGAMQACEETLLGPAADAEWTIELEDKVFRLQEERWALLNLIHIDPSTAQPSILSSAMETIVFAWTRLRSAIQDFTEELPAWSERERLHQVASQLDAALGLDAGAVPPPHLWEHGGKPAMPKNPRQMEAVYELLRLCACQRVTSDGFASCDPIFTDAVAKALESSSSPEYMEVSEADQREYVCSIGAAAELAAEVAAVLAVDGGLRRQLLEGACLLEVKMQLQTVSDFNKDEDEDDVMVGIEAAAAFERLAAAAAAAAVQQLNGDKGSSCSGGLLLQYADQKTMPASAMGDDAGRAMQLRLMAWLDAWCSRQQLAGLAGPGTALLSLMRAEVSPSSVQNLSQLGNVASSVASSGCRDISEGVPYNLLLWLVDAQGQGSGPLNASTPEWEHAVQQSVAHEAWFRWHCGLWSGAAAARPVDFAASRSLPEALGRWQSMDGPMRLHTCTLTGHALAVTGPPRVAISARSTKLMQLQLAGRHLRSLTASPRGALLHSGGVARAETRAALLVAAATLQAHLVDFSVSLPEVKAAIARLAQNEPFIDAQGILEVLDGAVQGCSHRVLREVGPLTLLPALHLLLTQSAVSEEGSQGLLVRGQAWALLGLFRLVLIVPPSGTDPAAFYDLLRGHILRALKGQLEPELLVRGEYAALPGGPSEQPAIKNLVERKARLEEEANELQGRSPARPDPPRYLALQEDVARFASGLAALPRMVDLVNGVAQRDAGAVAEARAWMDSAAAVVARLPAQFPGYRDIVQPVQLAVQEVRYGLALGVGAAEMAAAGEGQLGVLEAVTAKLIAFPYRCEAAVRFESQNVQMMVANMAGQRAHAASRDAAKSGAASHAAAAAAKLELLRAALLEVRDEWRRSATGAARSEAVGRLHAVFSALMATWEDIKEEEARRAAEEAELFKTKARTVGAQTEEEEAEKDFQEQYPDQHAAFSDLVDDDDLGNNDAPLLPQKPAAGHAAEAAAAYTAKDYLFGEVLQDVVTTHAELFSAGSGESSVGLSTTDTAAFVRSYDLGMRLVELTGAVLPASLDELTLTGHLRAAAIRARALVATPHAADAEDRDIRESRAEEAVLVQEPLLAVRSRLRDLLAEWPDHPMLMQLDAIAARVLGMPVDSPIKALLTGLELLLASAQTWEETAAKHVTLESQLKAVAGVATRWRRLELTGWRKLLERTVERATQGAYHGWFHMYRILEEGDSPTADIAATVEQFVQAAPLGEFAARLKLLQAFEGQLLAATWAGEEKNVVRRRALAALLRNIRHYYSQFMPAVATAVATAMAPLEKDLKDFVALAKWEDRGYYAMKASTEKAQRHLHRLCRRAADALKEPSTVVFAAAAKSMGLNDLSSPETVKSSGAAAASSNQTGPSGPTTVTTLTDAAAAAKALAAAAATRGQPDGAAFLAIAGGKYTKQLPELTARFEKILLRGLQSEAVSPAASALQADELASDAAERAVQLRCDVAKGAKARKKKALVDFFRALGAAGVSKLRSAVPAANRGFQAWLAEPVPDLASLLDGAATPQQETACAAWSKADAYYYASMARLQRLLQASVLPHDDLAPAEVEAACRSSEYLVYLAQSGRTTLGRCAEEFSRLEELLTAVAAPDWHRDIPAHQAWAEKQFQERQNTLAALLPLAAETQELLAAAAELEPDNEARRKLFKAAEAVGPTIMQLQRGAEDLRTVSQSSCILPSGRIFVTLALMEAMAKVDATMRELVVQLQGHADHTGAPGWDELVAALQRAATSVAVAMPPLDSAMATDSAALLRSLADELEAMVQAELVWAQGNLGGEPSGEEPGRLQPLPQAVAAAAQQLGIDRLSKIVQHAARALDILSELAGSGDSSAVQSGAAMLVAAVPMLRLLRAAAWQNAARCLALHRSLCKLAYVTSALFAGVVEEGFCMPEGDQDGEPAEGKERMMEGTGLGEGDTRDAKDISDELEDQDQLLGAQQKGQEERDEAAAEPPPGEEGAKGVEMDDDFAGALEDLKPDENEEQQGASEEDEGPDERLDQQMGDVGDAGEDVDERLWNGDDDEEDATGDKEEAGHDQDNAVKVEDASKLDYAQGQDQDEEKGGGNDKAPTEAPPREEAQDELAPEEEAAVGEEDDQDLGEYEDRPEDRGHVHPEAPDEELDLPEELNLDGGEAEEGGEEEEGAAEEDAEAVVREDGGAFPEQPEGEQGGDDAEFMADEEDGKQKQEEQQPGAPDEDDVAFDPQQQQQQMEEDEEAAADEQEGGEDEPMLEAGEEQPEGGEDAQLDGVKGSAAAAAAGIDQGAGMDEAEDNDARGDEELGATAPEGAPEPAQAATGSAAGASGGLQDDATATQVAGQGGAQLPDRQQQRSASLGDSNPFRNLGSALERWRAKLAMAADAPEPSAKEEDGTVGVQPEEQPNLEAEEAGGGEYRFLGHDEAPQAGDTQALAGATEEQAGVQSGEEPAPEDGADDAGGAAALEEAENDQDADDMAVDSVDGVAPPPSEQVAGKTTWGAGAGEKAGLQNEKGGKDEEMQVADEPEAAPEEEEGEGGAGAEDDAVSEGLVSPKLRATHLDDQEEEGAELLLEGLSGERAEELRAELDRRLRAASEGSSAEGDAAHGQEVWTRCEALTAGLVGELAEQLRLILEPTLASKLGGEYRTGKRINMKRVIGYIASHFRKDKIWMRRTRPDKRRYQVLVAVDDSRSMAETGCSGFALEALALICKAMARLDVGELGVVSFGGAGGARPLHALDRPFTDADGVRVMSNLRFDQDNTISDRPMVDVITSVDHLLEGAAARATATAAGPAALHQLVLIIADGRFHEKEALKRAARDAASRPGALYAFIVLDNPANSILDMQSVAFTGGKPVFTKYMDSFPFPFYIVLRDTAALPRTLADLLRQWFELQQH